MAFKKEKNKYWFLDSVNGIISLTKEQLKKGWEINKQQGFCAQLIAYKNMKICAIGDPHGNLKKVKKIPLKDIDLILINGDLGKADIAREFAFKNLALRNKGLPELEYDSKKVKEIYMEIYSSMTSLLKYLVKFAPVYSLLGNLGGDMMKDKIVKKEEKEYKIKLPYLGREIKKNKRISFDSK